MPRDINGEFEEMKRVIKKLLKTCPQEKEPELRDKLQAILDQQAAIAAANIKKQGEKYDAALAELVTANASIEKSITDCEDAEKTVAHIGSALDAVARVFA